MSDKQSNCQLCGKPECDCTAQRGPFDLYDKRGICCGAYVHIDTALICLGAIQRNTSGPRNAVLIDRHGCPVTPFEKPAALETVST